MDKEEAEYVMQKIIKSAQAFEEAPTYLRAL